ncbi:MAG: substrate-binding domain-containing protein [Sporomusaceae bacterium]|nr:substrate-binding domain-containing protein [Sporomusaceae bacterium]
MKKTLGLLLTLVMCAVLLAGCGGSSGQSPAKETAQPNTNKLINVISREDGSGTRGAFIELFKIEETVDGKRKDATTKEAVIANKTDVMLTNVANDANAIGYVSLGSLSSSVKALDIDGVKATTDNVKNNTYKISRPFNIATKGEAGGLAKDFVDYILSAEGQDVVVKNSYIAVNEKAEAYKGAKPAGKIVVAGSSSVTPVMEKLKEAYLVVNPNASIEIQMSDSTAGMTGALNGTCDIGMASRDLKESEKEQLQDITIAMDGIAVIVNPHNTASAMTSAAVKDIFTGKAAKWSDVLK